MKISRTKKTLLAAFLIIAISASFKSPLTISGAKPNFAETTQTTATDRGDEKKIKEAFGKLPLYFIESRQGSDDQTGYYIQGKDKSLYFTPQGITVTLESAPEVERDSKTARVARIKEDDAEENQPEPDIEARRWNVKLEFLGANPQTELSGQQQTPARISYFTGGKSEWRTGLKTYSSIIYRDLWPGIDLVYSGTATQVKHEFIVRPGGDPRDIKLAWRGASSVRLNKEGQLEIATPVSSFTDDKPYSYQEQDGKRAEVKTTYQLVPVEEEGVQVYGFDVGQYDHDQTLVIDPMMIIYCGYIGGGLDDMAFDVAVDGGGYAYVTGATYSDNSTNPATGRFPVTYGPDLTFNGGTDAFVAKIKVDGSGLVYCSYIGGSNGEKGFGLAVDNVGRAYVTGVTHSNLPDTLGFDRTYNGQGDAFVARIHQYGIALEYCSYLGGSDGDVGIDIAVDSNYNAYIIGNTNSSDFPTLIGPDLTYNDIAGAGDVFVTKMNSSGSAILYSGFIGGASTEYGYAIAVDSARNAYVTGETLSSEVSFPVTIGPDLAYSGLGDAFVAKVNATGRGLDYCGYLGGGSGDGIAVNSQGEAYICGYSTTLSTVVSGPFLVPQGGGDGFVARLNSSGTGFIYCGYLGGSDNDRATAIALDNVGRAYVTGVTHSTDFPVGGGPDSSFNGGEEDAFVTCVNPNGASLFYSSYLGGGGNEYPNGIAVSPISTIMDNVYGASPTIVGRTNSRPRGWINYVPFPVKTGPSLIYSGEGGIGWGDAFVTRIGPVIPSAPLE